MTTTVNNHYIPGGSSKAVKGTVYTFLGVPTVGARLGVAFSPMDKHREHLKSIARKIDPAEGLVNTHGGPYAYDNKDVFGDYVITYSGLTPEVASETAKLAKEYSIEQIDIIQGAVPGVAAEQICHGVAAEKVINVAGRVKTVFTFSIPECDKTVDLC